MGDMISRFGLSLGGVGVLRLFVRRGGFLAQDDNIIQTFQLGSRSSHPSFFASKPYRRNNFITDAQQL